MSPRIRRRATAIAMLVAAVGLTWGLVGHFNWALLAGIIAGGVAIDIDILFRAPWRTPVAAAAPAAAPVRSRVEIATAAVEAAVLALALKRVDVIAAVLQERFPTAATVAVHNDLIRAVLDSDGEILWLHDNTDYDDDFDLIDDVEQHVDEISREYLLETLTAAPAAGSLASGWDGARILTLPRTNPV